MTVEPVVSSNDGVSVSRLVDQLLVFEQSSNSASVSDSIDLLSHVIKSIFKNGKQEAFIEQLRVYVHKKENEIERMCNFHYQEFVQSVDQLLKVRVGTVNLKNKIVELNHEIQQSASKIVDKKKEIIENNKMLQNIDNAMETLQICSFVLEILNKVIAKMESRKFYSALRLLEELETVHLKHVAQHEFAKRIQESIPVIKDQIKEAVTGEMRDWFIKVRENSRRVGKLAMEQTALRQDQSPLNRRTANRNESGVISGSMEIIVGEEMESSIVDNDQVKVDFKPLYQCLHIYDVLGIRDQFKSSYEANRRTQSGLILNASISFKTDLSAFENYLHEVVGFFIIESVVMNSTADFRSRHNVEIIWSSAKDKIQTVISDSLMECDDPSIFLKVKSYLITFIQTLEAQEFPVTQLMDLLMTLFERYCELDKNRSSEEILNIIENDEYCPYSVQNPKEFEAACSVYKHLTDEKESFTTYPRVLPFSKGFIQCCRVIQDYITGFYKFAEGFSQQYGEMDDLLQKSLENLLSQHLNKAMEEKLQSTNFSQVVQVIVNVEHFVQACEQFEELLSEQRVSNKGGLMSLQATQAFKHTRLLGSRRIHDLINMKIDLFLEVADYEWCPAKEQPSTSAYLQDLVNFLTNIITSTLIHLHDTTKSIIYYDAFEHLATGLMSIMLSPNAKKINDKFLNNFDKDAAYLESFVAELGDSNIANVFLEIRQTIQYLRSDNLEEYLNQNIKNKKYPKVKDTIVIVMLEKMKGDSGVFANMTSKSTASEKSRKKSMELIVKTLRQQQNVSGHHS